MNVPVQATYMPAQDELQYAWWLCMGTLLWATVHVSHARAKKLPIFRWNDLVKSIISAAISYAFALEFLDVAVVADDWRHTAAEYPNTFVAFVGFMSHNLPKAYELAGQWVKSKAGK